MKKNEVLIEKSYHDPVESSSSIMLSSGGALKWLSTTKSSKTTNHLTLATFLMTIKMIASIFGVNETKVKLADRHEISQLSPVSQWNSSFQDEHNA